MLILIKLLAKYFIIIYAMQVLYMKSLASESKLLQGRSTVTIPGQARREEQLSHSKLKQAFLTDSDAELFMYLIPMYNETSKGQKQKSLTVAHDEELDKALYVWFIQQQTSSTPVSGPPNNL